MSTNKQKSILNDFLSNRGDLIELIIVAIALGLGIEFLASALYNKATIQNKDTYFLAIGLIISISCIGFFFIKFFSNKKISKQIKAFIIINIDSNQIISIDNYDFARTLERDLKAATTEDRAIEMDWNDASFNYDAPKAKREKAYKIINELTEYYILETISTHLTDFFNKDTIRKEEIMELSRNDIPSILLSNQFLELFSKPIEQRAVFKENEKPNKNTKKPIGRVIAIYSKGAIFQHFDLKLPKNSNISKDKEGFITIKTKRLSLKFKSRFSGMGTILPMGFEKYYLDIEDRIKNHSYEINIDFEFELNFGSLLLRNGWNYYNWVDSLLAKIEDKTSKNKYFKKISWNKAYATIKAINNTKTS